MTPAEQMREAVLDLIEHTYPDISEEAEDGGLRWQRTIPSQIAAAIRALPLPPEPEPPIVAELEAALRPFADRVFNDNGDCVVTDTYRLKIEDFVRAYYALAKLAADRERRKG